MTPDQEDYVRRFLGGTGIYSRIIVQDRSVPSPFSPVDESFKTDADRLLVTYVRDRVHAGVAVETVREAPSPVETGYPSGPSYRAPLRTCPAGVVIIAIHYKLGPRIPDSQMYEAIPYIAFYGDPATTGGRAPC